MRHIYITMNHCCLYHGITFVIINQITSSISEGYQQGSALLPSLGNTVTQFTHHRFMLCRRGSTYPSAAIFDLSNVKDIAMENKNNVPSDLIRDFYVLFSPRLGPRRTSFTITQDGVVALYLCL